MGEQWYNKSALIRDLSSLTRRRVHSGSLNPVFKTPPVLPNNGNEDINEINLRFGIDIDIRDDNKGTDSAMFNFIPDMLSMVRDYEETSSCMEQPLESGPHKLVISKLNPNSRDFVPKPTLSLVKNNCVASSSSSSISPGEIQSMLPNPVNINNNKSKENLKLNVVPEAKANGVSIAKCETIVGEAKGLVNGSTEENAKNGIRRKKRFLNIALNNLSKLHQISKEISEKLPEHQPLKLFPPDYYMNSKHAETKPADGAEAEKDIALQTSLTKVQNWLDGQQEDSSTSSSSSVQSKNNNCKSPGPFEPIVYKKKVITPTNKECIVSSPRSTPTITRTKKFVPSQTSEEYYKTFCDRNERKAMARHNLWDRVEAELRKREEKKKIEVAAQQTLSESSPDSTQTN